MVTMVTMTMTMTTMVLLPWQGYKGQLNIRKFVSMSHRSFFLSMMMMVH